MELALNLVWAGVAVAGILAQIVMLSRDTAKNQQGNNCRKIVAMMCTLVILFFVISMTDDLHDQEILVEERRASKITTGTRFSPQSYTDPLLSLAVLPFPPAPLSHSLPALRRPVDSPKFLFAAMIECESVCGRAPPALLA